jgi:uncharacterized protein (DUF2147 family)
VIQVTSAVPAARVRSFDCRGESDEAIWLSCRADAAAQLFGAGSFIFVPFPWSSGAGRTAAAPPSAVAAQATAAPAVPPRTEFKVLAVEKPAATVQAAPEAVPTDTKVSQASSGPADTPLGDWQAEGNKGLVRIEPCGRALCGYAVDTASNAKGETVLINMTPKGADEWTGTIVSRASGSTYYAKMSMKQSATLRVEACAVGRFFCSGNDWSRIVTEPQALITSRQIAARPPS